MAIDTTSRFDVALGDGTMLRINGICLRILLKIQGNVFTLDLHPFALQGTNIVLGMQWMQSLGPVTFDFSEIWMNFKQSGKQVRLDEIRPWLGAQLQPMVGLPKFGCHGLLMQLIQSQVGHAKEEEVPTDLSTLLKEFSEVFEEAHGMPPARPQDHHIEITPKAEPASVWPYRYPFVQKEDITRFIKEMLDKEIIQPSRSSYSSSVLLVRKKDET
ncbi:uncharacterized protein [Typha latifolia]|uniref:uncharacterized protein n=1 Tax=Typha latifolia TaxID=4733 RepID=UPI003C2E56D3